MRSDMIDRACNVDRCALRSVAIFIDHRASDSVWPNSPS